MELSTWYDIEAGTHEEHISAGSPSRICFEYSVAGRGERNAFSAESMLNKSSRVVYGTSSQLRVNGAS